MKQSSLDLNLSTRRTRKRVFLEQMDTVVPWATLLELIARYYSQGRNGRLPFPLETMLRVHFMQQWFSLSDPTMEEASFDTPLNRKFPQLNAFSRMPDLSTIVRFRDMLGKYTLAEKIMSTVNEVLEQRGLRLKVVTPPVDATLIAEPSSTKNKAKVRDPEMHSSQMSKQWYFSMKAHIGVDADSGLVHTVVRGSSGNVADVNEGNSLLHGQETKVYGEAGYRCVGKRPDDVMSRSDICGRWPCA